MLAYTHDGFDPVPMPQPLRSTIKLATQRMVAAAWRAFGTWRLRREAKRTTAELRALGTRQLRDIGLSRIEIGSLPTNDDRLPKAANGETPRAGRKGGDRV